MSAAMHVTTFSSIQKETVSSEDMIAPRRLTTLQLKSELVEN
jgi:hypothetical protein